MMETGLFKLGNKVLGRDPFARLALPAQQRLGATGAVTGGEFMNGLMVDLETVG